MDGKRPFSEIISLSDEIDTQCAVQNTKAHEEKCSIVLQLLETRAETCVARYLATRKIRATCPSPWGLHFGRCLTVIAHALLSLSAE